MKLTSLFKVALAVVIATGFTACSDDDDVKLANLNVQLDIAETFSGLDASNMYVYITNTIDNAKDSALTNADGIATFIDLAPGTYNVSASMALTVEQASAAAGYYEEMTLNAVQNDVELMPDVTREVTIELNGTPGASLVIKEFYYNGANDPTYSVMFKDQFVEIYNNSSEVVYADGLYLAGLAVQADGSDANDTPIALDLTEYVYATKILQVPGSGQEYPIEPGSSIVICLNAVDYTDGGAKADITVDLSGADFETYAIPWLESLGRQGSSYFDLDNADVPNMTCIYNFIENYGWFNFDIKSASIVIFRNDNFEVETVANPEKENPGFSDYFVKINVDDIIDGIDMMRDADKGAFKRLPSTVDAGFKYVEGSTYTSKSVRRKVAKEVNGRKILMDSNNSTKDFEAIDLPTPRAFE